MGDCRRGEHRPIQTSAVIVLSGSWRPITRPPSPPTPSAMPADSSVPHYNEPLDSFQLAEVDSRQYMQSSSSLYTESQCIERAGRIAKSSSPSTSTSSSSSPSSSSEDQCTRRRRLRRGIHVLSTEAAALANLTRLYETDPVAQTGFHAAVSAILRQYTTGTNGKLILIGVGKSGLIAKKLVATFQSLAVRAVFLHPTEALHGDLGIVGPHDVLLFITYSGATEELLRVLPHLDEALPTILVTSHVRPDTCEFVQRRPGTVLLPAPVHEAERASFGVAAPTTSTTAALALGDALAMTVAQEMHGGAERVAHAFARNHPGGAIGVAAATAKKRQQQQHLAPPRAKTLRQIFTLWDDIHDASHLCGGASAASLLREGYASKNGWVRVGEDVAAPSQLRRLGDEDLLKPLGQMRSSGGRAPLLVSCHDMLAMSADTTVRQARDMLFRGSGGGAVGEDTAGGSLTTTTGLEEDGESVAATTGSSVIAVTENGRICGVVEAALVFEQED